MLCRFCSAEIPVADIELSQRLAKCRACNQVFVFEVSDLPGYQAATAPTARPPDVAPGRPESIKLVDEYGRGYLQWSWFHPTAFFLLFFCIAWDSFLVFWYWMALGGGAKGGFNLIAILFPICHVAVGVGLTYQVLLMFFNRTQIVFDGNFLSVRHGPLPYWGNASYAKEEVKGFEVSTVWNQNHTMSPQHVKGTLGQLYILIGDNVRKPFVKYGYDDGSIRFIRWQLETWLGLPHRS